MATDRRTRFREYMRRLDPTGDPLQAVTNGFYVSPPNSVSQRIATRIELEPASSHLLVGGIGSGKTTELIAIERNLAEVEDLFAVRVDVPSRHRLDKLKPGVLIAMAAIEVCAELKREKKLRLVVGADVVAAVERISEKTKGFWIDDVDFPDSDSGGDGHWVNGILEEPEASEDVTTLSDALNTVHGALQRKLVILFDGLDRVTDLAVLASVLLEDVPAMGRAGVGVVVVGPQHLRFSPQRSVERVFETVHLHGAMSVESDDGQTFLTEVLRKRADEDVLPGNSALIIANYSGGLLRDLVALARAAGAEAYANGSDTVELNHVEVAADRFGRDLILGCTKEMVTRLKELGPKQVPKKGTLMLRKVNPSPFTVATELDQRLLTERLMIEVLGTPVRYILHPTIKHLIAGLGAS